MWLVNHITSHDSLVASKSPHLYVRKRGSQNDHVAGEFIPVTIEYADGIHELSGIGPHLAHVYGGHPIRLRVTCCIHDAQEWFFAPEIRKDPKWLFRATDVLSDHIYYGVTGKVTDSKSTGLEQGKRQMSCVILVSDMPIMYVSEESG